MGIKSVRRAPSFPPLDFPLQPHLRSPPHRSLFPFLTDNASLSIKETKVEAMTGRTIAIDASMCLYQFLVAVRQGESQANLSNAAGEVTSHIQGFLSRTVRLLVRHSCAEPTSMTPAYDPHCTVH